ncbi:MAG: hypothetical protein WA691_07850 [Thermoplasmata archaeon]
MSIPTRLGGIVAVVTMVTVALVLGSFASLAPTQGALASGSTVSTDPVSLVPSTVQPTWTNLNIPESASPPPRISGSMAWDSTAGYALLFGGEYLNETLGHYVYYNDTWTFLDGKWTNATTSVAPSPRFGMGLADDPADQEVVLFGGMSAHGQFLNDTWVWTGGGWTNVTPTHSPPGVFWGSMAYDASTSSVLLFGGDAQGFVYTNATWSFRGGVWTQLLPTVSPPARDDQEMVYDAADSEMVMFGGNGAQSWNDTWTFSGSTWTPIAPGNHPGARVGPGIAYDSAAGKVTVYGGNTESADYYSTWLFSGGAWSQFNVTSSPPNPTNPWGQVAYDPTDNYVLLFYEVDASGPNMESWALSLKTASPAPIQATLSANPGILDVNQSTEVTTTATGGTGPYTYAYSDLPPGCSSQNASAISCTPKAAGVFVIVVNVTDAASDRTSAVTALDVVAAPPATSPPTNSMSSLWLWILIVVGVALVIVLIVVVLRRRRAPPTAPPSAGPPPQSP